MIDFQQKKKARKILYSKLSIFILLILVILLGRSTYHIYERKQLSDNDYASVKKSYDNLNAREVMLNSEIARLNTQSGIEEEIRSKFNVSKPGERVITVVNGSSSDEGKDRTIKNIGIWSRFTSWFK